MKGHKEVHAALRWIWKSSCQLKHNFFQMLLKDKLDTRDLLRRKNMVLQDYGCAIGGAGLDETLEHLFLKCSFATQCWSTLLI
jgi:hypothetical protein